jgi:hypothetical protein
MHFRSGFGGFLRIVATGAFQARQGRVLFF